jgi:hypothetical protein
VEPEWPQHDHRRLPERELHVQRDVQAGPKLPQGNADRPVPPDLRPQSGPISGKVRGNTVTFSFTYPTNVQGTRTYTGTISRWGVVSGNWSQTGTQVPSTGTWSLGTKAAHACPRFWWWSPRHECFVRSH